MRILVTDSAAADLQSIKDYYAQQDLTHIANKLLAKIIKRIESLQQHPDIGRIVPEFATEQLRELIERPFRIIYMREKSSIHIIRVWRSERILLLPDQNDSNS